MVPRCRWCLNRLPYSGVDGGATSVERLDFRSGPEIEDFVRQQFDILQLNIIGAREVTDFDGEKMSEKRLAERYGIRFTPTFQFFPERAYEKGSLRDYLKAGT